MGRAPQPPSDVFTIGVLAYEMLTGLLPFRARTLPELIGQMLQTVPAAVRSLNTDVPQAFSALLAGCLAADPAQRIQSAREFLEDL